jgi:hypothetical protein
MIEKWLGSIFRWVEFIGPNPFLQAIVIVLLFLVLGKLVDWLIGAALDRLLIRWDSGGRLGGIGHTTLFRTIVLLGLLVALEVLSMTPLLTRLTTAFIMSLLVLAGSVTIRPDAWLWRPPVSGRHRLLGTASHSAGYSICSCAS